MTLYGVLLALLPHRARALISPSYGLVIGSLRTPAARRRGARRIRGDLIGLAAGIASLPWRIHPRKTS